MKGRTKSKKVIPEAVRTEIPLKKPKRKRGRPETRVLKIDATPEEVEKAMFATAKRPDPSKRIKTPKE